ncbi:MAG: hypothetical protein ACK4YQ_06265 [Phenylobacterium sp.]|uniref:hypothetical protein n=1 Tax=Phenylobacterium sp. TaxID=1871053 RepID=UPI00391DCED4
MTSPVDPVRRTVPVRKAPRAHAHGRRAEAPTEETSATPAAPALEVDPVDEAVFDAHRLGQERRRGLRAGVGVLEAAKTAYTRTEFSGAADRRAPKGGLARTRI